MSGRTQQSPDPRVIRRAGQPVFVKGAPEHALFIAVAVLLIATVLTWPGVAW
jgi:hypothetical protein